MPFSIVGSTQVPFAVRLICRMDQGHGLLDRFLVWFPVCFRPTPQETEDAKAALEEIPLKSFTDVFIEMYNLHLDRKEFHFSSGAKEMLDSLNADFIKAVNDEEKATLRQSPSALICYREYRYLCIFLRMY